MVGIHDIRLVRQGHSDTLYVVRNRRPAVQERTFVNVERHRRVLGPACVNGDVCRQIRGAGRAVRTIAQITLSIRLRVVTLERIAPSRRQRNGRERASVLGVHPCGSRRVGLTGIERDPVRVRRPLRGERDRAASRRRQVRHHLAVCKRPTAKTAPVRKRVTRPRKGVRGQILRGVVDKRLGGHRSHAAVLVERHRVGIRRHGHDQHRPTRLRQGVLHVIRRILSAPCRIEHESSVIRTTIERRLPFIRGKRVACSRHVRQLPQRVGRGLPDCQRLGPRRQRRRALGVANGVKTNRDRVGRRRNGRESQNGY